MNDDVSNSEFQNDELDRVIRAALVVDANPRGVERLEQYWHVQSRKDRWQRRGYFAMTAAAAAVVLIGLLIVAKDGDDDAKTASAEPEPVQVRAGARVEIDETVRVERVEGTNEPSPGPSLPGTGLTELAGRAPTEYERIMFIARTGKLTPAMAESKADELNRPRPVNSEEALAEIERTGGVEGLVRAAGGTAAEAASPAAMGRLLEIGTDEALLGFLALVRDGSTQARALMVADSASQLPLDAFLAFLDHDDRGVRRSAALVLGHVNGPEVTQALIARVTEEPSRETETWMALMKCRGEMAQQFVAYAATRPRLLGHLNGARVQLAYAVP